MARNLNSQLLRSNFFVLSLVFFFLGCGSNSSNDPVKDLQNRHSELINGPAEVSYCNTPLTYPSSYTISGKATFTARKVSRSHGLGDEGSPEAIRYAEFRVTDKQGKLVQCGETNGQGFFTFKIPQLPTNKRYTLSINTRANNANIKISVLKSPEKNQFYALTTSFIAETDKDIGTLNASSEKPQVLSGAFNIYNQILLANEFLRKMVGTCQESDCDNFSVAPKAAIYWKAGFNPSSYISQNSDPVSFYVPGYRRLFILGGQNGDVNYSDTDHFDNSVILHEYGHFLEDVYGQLDSPGGTHNGNSVIDPRLAWSEGFANFFQAAVRNKADYIDTLGISSPGFPGLAFMVDLESYNECDANTPGCDRARQNGEGNFREFAITRMLWDAHDDTPNESEAGGQTTSEGSNTLDNISGKFQEIWSALFKAEGLKKASFAFRSVGLFNFVQNNAPTSTNFQELRKMHRIDDDSQKNFRGAFAFYVAKGFCSMNFSLEPRNNDCTDGNGQNCSKVHNTRDLLSNTRIFHYKHERKGPLNIRLNYKTENTIGAQKANLDLYIFQNGNLRVPGTQLAESLNNPVQSLAFIETESVSSYQDAGDYLIVVHSRLGQGSQTYFELKVGDNNLCPTKIP